MSVGFVASGLSSCQTSRKRTATNSYDEYVLTQKSTAKQTDCTQRRSSEYICRLMYTLVLEFELKINDVHALSATHPALDSRNTSKSIKCNQML